MPSDLKSTLNLPGADFGIPMKADLAKREPGWIQAWNEMGLYKSVQHERDHADTFVFHDGPPYTNGPIHLGTAMNKVLKDIAVRAHNLFGYRASFVPGYDNHGLPIEQAVMKKFAEKKITPTTVELRQACRQHAEHYIGVQTEQFERLGVLATWDNPYTSMGFRYEAEIIRVFKRMVEGGYVYRGLRSVLWSPTSRTALADTETLYHDHVSTSIYVAFPLGNDTTGVFEGLANVACVIWTTTPWTIPANVAVAFHPGFTYDVVKVGDRHLVILNELVEKTLEKTGLTGETVRQFKGSEVEGVEFRHPLFDRVSLAVLADYVTTEDGTGIVHTAPGHGREDFMTGQKYNLPVLCPVDERGVMTAEAGEFEGLFYRNAEPKVVERLTEVGALLHTEPYPHKYPYAERDDQPVIFRATEQWFIGMDKPFHLDARKTLRQQILDEIEEVQWFPRTGHTRIRAMIEGRPDWCISRQRPWGVGIPVFYGKESGEPVLDPVAIEAVAQLVQERGSDAWYEVEPADILPAGYKHPTTGETEFRKEVDVFDVWFDSGATHLCVLEGNVDPAWREPMPADLVLEGSDQHRGWFNVSLILGTGCRGEAPFRQVVTHGMVTDDKGIKQSKRLGNVIDPLIVCQQHGADILRTWVATVDYETDMPCTDSLIKSAGELYRSVRNTIRFLLMNLYDSDAEAQADLLPIDQWVIEETDELAKRVRAHYQVHEFNKAFSAVHGFCVNELSRFYLDAIKDRMYCDGKDWPSRRSAQRACLAVAHKLNLIVSPILPFTADEVYKQLPMPLGHKPSVFHEELTYVTGRDTTLQARVSRMLEVRGEMSVALEAWKQEHGVKDSQDVEVTLHAHGYDHEALDFFRDDLATFFRVAAVHIHEGQPEYAFKVSELEKCERSRVRRPGVQDVALNGETVRLSPRDRRALGIA
jgi:isoleucyl-tRNA synthetase